MYRLVGVYGKRAYDAWDSDPSTKDLRKFKETRDEASAPWPVRSYTELVGAVSFLSVMNKRLVLHFRGQTNDYPLFPSLLRESWPRCESDVLDISNNREHYFAELEKAGYAAYIGCKEFGLPRWRSVKHVPEAQWAVVQHYELWPTPFLDVTRSLRVAASFAFGWEEAPEPRIGHLYALGMPVAHDSISVSFDDQMMLARLEAVCPPSARRPHFQEGTLVSRFPFAVRELSSPKLSNAARRLVAHFTLVDDGEFWTAMDFPPLSKNSLLPSEDPLREWFETHTRIDVSAGLPHFVLTSSA